jgi:undecaprenyl-diphosphatase
MTHSLSFWTALVYGAVQGLTEYLPVSSSAHLILLPRFLGISEPGLTFDVFLHAGTLCATLLYFRREWVSIFKTLLAPRAQTGIGWVQVTLACIPVLVVGALGREWISEHLRGTRSVAWGLIVGGVLLYLADRVASVSKKERTEAGLESRDALGVGIFQCLALWPGMSRSGSTILGARLLGFSRQSAARFSFLVSAPVTAAALVFELRHWGELMSGLGDSGVSTVLVAGVSSFVFGWLAIDGLIRWVSRFSLGWFSLYRILLGTALILYF